ncbi:ABC transporter permease [Hoeflea prorocentri]|uniref:ABC transporter permease n=1 Tax=Hoeflea prorocentri TaxID=1922333 RepID=A0A9X3ZH82_9HYPH|nr:ABC transporter permease [Hoeflea prorocentri]MCY6381552.1 ABC transporter permease [Hoeflea prorocentri]MDA5399352.1 ABC transporter permease [Hoeflea prorocentri]
MSANETVAQENSVDRRVVAALFVRIGAYAALAAILLYFAFNARGFTSAFNLQNVVEQSAILTMLAFGMTFVFIGTGTDIQKGGVDLSVAANAGLCGAVLVTVMNLGYSEIVAIPITLLTGMAMGFLNSIAVVSFRIMPLLATLAVMNIAAGLELTITENSVVGVESELLSALQFGRFLGISALAWILLLFTAFAATLAHFTPFGVKLYAVGGFTEAARAAGLNVGFYVYFSYMFSGLCAAIASIMIVSRLSAASLGTGLLLLPVLAAALLGTVFSRRFVPTIGGTLIASLFIGFLANGFQLLGISSFWVSGVQGALILLVVALTSFAKPAQGS